MNENNKKVLDDLLNKTKEVAGNAAKEIGNEAKEKLKDVNWKDVAKDVKEGIASGTKKATDAAKEKIDSVDWQEVGDKTKEGIKKAAQKTGDTVTKGAVIAKEKTIEALDANGDGTIGIDDIIINSLKVPGIKINRSEFLRKELSRNYKADVIEKAVEKNPAGAGITTEEIDKIADSVIEFERNCVSGISAALSTPGGFAMVATIPADIAQYYGYMLRCAQKLMYLYGFPQIDIKESNIDTATLNALTICLAVMYGVAGANSAIKAMAKALGVGVEKKLLNTALTKGAFYPLVKSIAKWFGKKMTKEVFAGFFKKAIPVVGGVVGGTITYVTFKPCCEKLKESLKDTILCNPDHQSTKEEEEFVDAIIKEKEVKVDPIVEDEE